MPNGGTVTHTYSNANGVPQDQRTYDGPRGGVVINDRTYENGRYNDTRNGTFANGSSFSNTRTES